MHDYVQSTHFPYTLFFCWLSGVNHFPRVCGWLWDGRHPQDFKLRWNAASSLNQATQGHCHWCSHHYLFRDALSRGDLPVNMICLALPLHCGFLFHAIETFIMAHYTSLPLASSQGHFPRLENVGSFKNISIVPTQATCGLPDRSAFCQSSAAVESILSCTQQFCIQECPYRSSPAPYAAMLSKGQGACITKDKNDLHPGSLSNSSSFIFHNLKGCFSTPHARKLGASFTLIVWLKPEKEGVM